MFVVLARDSSVLSTNFDSDEAGALCFISEEQFTFFLSDSHILIYTEISMFDLTFTQQRSVSFL